MAIRLAEIEDKAYLLLVLDKDYPAGEEPRMTVYLCDDQGRASIASYAVSEAKKSVWLTGQEAIKRNLRTFIPNPEGDDFFLLHQPSGWEP